MTKIEELHMSVCDERPDSYNLSAHAKVTEDIACKFAKFAKNQTYWELNDLGYISTSELFQEFIKTL